MKFLKVTAIILAASSAGINAEQVNQEISIGKYNTFIFDKPYKTLVFEPGTIIDEPIPLNGNDGFLLRVPENQKNFQLVVELKNGETVEFHIQPKDIELGTTYRRNGAGIFSEPEGQRSRPSDAWVVETLKSALTSEAPSGFMEAGKPLHAELGDTTLIPIQRYTNNIHEVLVYKMSSTSPKTIQPKDFWHDGVEGIQIEGDIVSDIENPTLIILRGINQNVR